MWYVIAEYFPGTIAWWGSYENEDDAEKVAELVNGAAMKVNNWDKFKEIMVKVMKPLQAEEVVM